MKNLSSLVYIEYEKKKQKNLIFPFCFSTLMLCGVMLKIL